MCGICGFKSDEIAGEDQLPILRKMVESLIHRGPDDEGCFQHHNMAMGMRRLSVIDLKTGKQPIYSNNRNLVIVYNGEIYNYRELRQELIQKGYQFETHTDTEVIVNLYQHKGVKCLQDLNGMFAFAIYDTQNDELFIARDRFGIKPLYYTYQNHTLIFGSELKALLCYPDLSTNISLEALDLYLTFEYVPAPYSIFEDIYKLKQGHYLFLKDGELSEETYYSVTYRSKFTSSNHNDYLDELDALIDQAVKRRTISDVPLGAFLSGGIDSSMITYYLTKNSNKKVQTFNIGFGEKSFDESSFARQIADFLGTDHHGEIFTVIELLEILPAVIAKLDEPFGDASLLPTYLLSQFTRENVTVALSGDGGDEVFAGYPTYYARKLAGYVPKWSYPLFRFGAGLLPVNDGNISFDFKAKKFAEELDYEPDLRHQLWLGSFNPAQKRSMYSKEVLNLVRSKDHVADVVCSHMKNCDTENNWERSLFLDMRFYLQDNMLVKVDRTSMMNSLETRVPFLDHTVVEYVLRIPANLKYRGRTSKYILKQLAKRYIPENVITRPKKGFGIPVAKWIKGELKELVLDTFSESKIKREGFFDHHYLKSLLDDHFAGRRDNRKLIWTLLVFEMWYTSIYE